MLAKQLENVLIELCRDGDVTSIAPPEMEQRFTALRGYGHLPRGRENRDRALTDEQIGAAVLGLTTVEPGWAGHGATILVRLQPVGAVASAFGEAPTFLQAMAKVIGDKALREALISVRMSVAESGTNSHGSACIVWTEAGDRRRTDYVPAEAVSLLQPDIEQSFDAERRHAPFGRESVLSGRFFKDLARRVAYARDHPQPLSGDGAEYDAEDAERERRVRLGAKPSSRYLHVGVDNQVTWPREESLIEFEGHKLVLMPKTKDHVQSIHVDLHGNRLTDEAALTLINRFLSLLCWCDDQFAIAQPGWIGNPVPVPVSRRNLAFTTTYQWIFNRTVPVSDEGKRALALYREARNAEQNYMIGHAVLNFYKVIEIRYPEGKDARNWIAQTFPTIRDDPNDQHGIAKFIQECGAEPPERYIYNACRVAVAHASRRYPSDPDDAAELRRLDNAADVMRRLARHFISIELGISDNLMV